MFLRKTKSNIFFLLGVIFECASAMTHQANTFSEVRNLVQSGRLSEASKEIGRQLQRPDPDPGLQLLQCVVMAQLNEIEKAIGCHTELVKQRPDMLEAYNNLGVLNASLNQNEEAKRWLSLAMQRQPTLWTVHQNLQSLTADISRRAYARALQSELPLKDAAPKLTLLATTSMSHVQIASAINKANDTAVLAKAPYGAQLPASPLEHAPTQVSTSKNSNAPLKTPAKSLTTSSATPAVQPEPVKPHPTVQPAQSVRPDTSPTASETDGLADRETGIAKAGKELNEALQQELQKSVQAWAKAWSSQNMQLYFSAYSPEYKQSKSNSRAAWEAEREARIVDRQFVRVEVSNISFEKSGNKVIARFTQLYESDSIKSKQRKRLDFIRLAGDWKITRETVMSN